MDKQIESHLNWYITELEALERYSRDGNSKAAEASLVMLRLDAGRRAKAIKAILEENDDKI